MSRKLVILDNDGVLVDSERISHRIMAAYLTELGYPTTFEEAVRRFLGTAARNVHQVIADLHGGRLPDDFVALWQERVFAAFREDLTAVPGAPDLLADLRRRGTPYCLASSSDHAWIDLTLDRTGLRAHLPPEAVFSAQDVGGVGKPAPDLFLHAAASFRVHPADCLVVEDSPNGVLAARAAGMDVLGYTALTPADRLRDAGATHLITSLSEVTDHL
ncbi:HAD family phosphatase [Actinomadura logoneensis]|uniref:HAD family phosphatase n=1 Tax=Actinomadura logoneensis TaxID=2293572 RepID=A0A372JDS9_9ACTN|nr:HAD family phosphatase [Actinomadura logoneensis]RFU37994.1 HAD family phosphatase [Actinomadura logoneensis]